MHLDKESFFISLFNNRFIGDDGAFIDGYVYSADGFYEDVHFKREWMNYWQIAKKAMLVTISAAIAMNAKPKYALVTVAMPKDIASKQMRQVAKGLQEIAKEYGCQIVGGDTVASNKLDISITIVSTTKKPIGRKPLKKGYLLAYTGELGSVGKDLRKLLRGMRVSKYSKFLEPKLRAQFMQRAARKIKVCMDISDGLFDDLGKLARLNSVGFEFFEKIPKRVGCSGEEYELLFAFDPRDRKALEIIAKKTRTPITIFAKVANRAYKNRCKPNHF